jgi:hypothetical protein
MPMVQKQAAFRFAGRATGVRSAIAGKRGGHH